MTNRKSLLAVLASLAVLLGAPVAFAGTGIPSSSMKLPATNTESINRTMSDEAFAKMAAEGGLAEVKLGQLAEEKGTSQAVQEFGKRMVTDHSKADDELKATAANDKITLPTEISANDKDVYNRLLKLSGAEFDRAYARDMVRDHSADIAEFRQEARNGKDASIKSFASQTLPTLEEHLKLAHQMLSSVSSENHNQTKRQQS